MSRFVLFLVAFGCAMAMLYFLWRHQMMDFYTVLIGAAYFYFAREDKKKEGGDAEEL